MYRFHRRSLKVTALWVAVLLVTQLACGLSTANQTQSAPPPPTRTLKPTSVAAATQVPQDTATVQPSATAEGQSSGSEASNPGLPTEIPTQEQASGEQPTEPAVSTQPAAPTQPVAAEDLQLVDQGFGQNQQQFGYAFIVENPNPDTAIESSQFQVSAYDDSGAVVDTDSASLNLILPGQKVGVSGLLYLDEGITVTNIEVQIDSGDAASTDYTTPFPVEKTVYRPGDYFAYASGVVSNPYDQDLTDLQVSAVAYDAGGSIIGGGMTYINFILANSSTGVDVSMVSGGEVDHVELYPTVSSLTSLSYYNPPPSDGQALKVDKQGFGQDSSSVGYGALVENPNAGYALDSSQYHVNFYDADGNILYVDEGYLNLVLPNQILGVADSIYLNEGEQAASMDFQVIAGNYTSAAEHKPFTSTNVNYQEDPYYPKVTGEIVNPYDQQMNNLLVTAVAYDDAGQIIGGGYTYLDFVPANDKAGVEVGLTLNGTPAQIELYASLSSLSDYSP